MGNVLLDSGVQKSLINEKFIHKNAQFKKVPILPINNTIVKTATNDTQTLNRQAFITIISQGIRLEVPVLVIKDLIYDVKLGTDTIIIVE